VPKIPQLPQSAQQRSQKTEPAINGRLARYRSPCRTRETRPRLRIRRRNAWDLLQVAAVRVFPSDVVDFVHKPGLEGDGFKTHGEESVVGDEQIVLVGFVAWVWDELEPRPRDIGHQRGKIADAMGLCHLIEDVDALSGLRRVLDRELDASNGVLKVDEGLRSMMETRAWPRAIPASGSTQTPCASGPR
jgi:hypothetical protein